MAVVTGLIASFVTAVCYGVATVFQAMGARRVAASDKVDPRLLVRVMRSMPFVIGLGLDTLGLVADLFALRTLPLFAVQAIMNTSLAVTALAAVPMLGITLDRRDRLAIAVVCAGLILIGFSADKERPAHAGTALHVGLLVVAVAITTVAFVVGRGEGGAIASSGFYGACAGGLFGVFAICVRVLTDLHPAKLVADPAAYALIISSLGGFLFFTTALQRDSVTAATAALVVGETAVPALLGVLLFNDHTRPGFAVPAVIGFVAAVGGALSLARYGEPAVE